MPTDASLPDRILEALEAHGRPMRPAEIAEEVGTSSNSTQHALKLLLKSDRVHQPGYGKYLPGPAPSEEDEYDEDDLVTIETLTVEAAAGDGAEIGWELVDDRLKMPHWYVRQVFGAPPDRVKRIRIIGESMTPTLRPGEFVFVVLFDPGEQPVSGGIYIIRSPFGLLVKRLIYRTETVEEGDEASVRYMVTLHSDNEEHGRDSIPLEVFRRDYYPLATLRSAEKAL